MRLYRRKQVDAALIFPERIGVGIIRQHRRAARPPIGVAPKLRQPIHAECFVGVVLSRMDKVFVAPFPLLADARLGKSSAQPTRERYAGIADAPGVIAVMQQEDAEIREQLLKIFIDRREVFTRLSRFP